MRGVAAHKPRLVGASVALAALLALFLTFHPPEVPWHQTMAISLQAAPFGEINKGAGVELGGVKIGNVDGVQKDGGSLLVRLRIDRSYASQLHADAGASIRPHGLLGPKYVELDPGTRGQIKDGAVIPSGRVHVAVDADQVINTLQPDVRDNLKVFLDEMGTAAEGHGQNVNSALKSLGDASQDLATTTAVLRQRDADLADFITASEILNRDLQFAPIDSQITSTDQVLTGLVQVEDSMGNGFDHTAVFAEELNIAMSGNSQNLAAILSKLPKTVKQLDQVAQYGTTIANGAFNQPYGNGPYGSEVNSLMWAVLYTKSSFGRADANGHYVLVYSCGDCFTDGPLAQQNQAGAAAGQASSAQPTSSSQVAPALNRSDIPDERLVALMAGAGT
jgi:virulence factor Mce-like protein